MTIAMCKKVLQCGAGVIGEGAVWWPCVEAG